MEVTNASRTAFCELPQWAASPASSSTASSGLSREAASTRSRDRGLALGAVPYAASANGAGGPSSQLPRSTPGEGCGRLRCPGPCLAALLALARVRRSC